MIVDRFWLFSFHRRFSSGIFRGDPLKLTAFRRVPRGPCLRVRACVRVCGVAAEGARGNETSPIRTGIRRKLASRDFTAAASRVCVVLRRRR